MEGKKVPAKKKRKGGSHQVAHFLHGERFAKISVIN